MNTFLPRMLNFRKVMYHEGKSLIRIVFMSIQIKIIYKQSNTKFSSILVWRTEKYQKHKTQINYYSCINFDVFTLKYI